MKFAYIALMASALWMAAPSAWADEAPSRTRKARHRSHERRLEDLRSQLERRKLKAAHKQRAQKKRKRAERRRRPDRSPVPQPPKQRSGKIGSSRPLPGQIQSGGGGVSNTQAPSKPKGKSNPIPKDRGPSGPKSAPFGPKGVTFPPPKRQ